jgi:hypothetical protein
MPHTDFAQSQSSPLLPSLFIEALRGGHSLWFRVASNSMFPLLRVEDQVYIQSAKAQDIRPGEIAAFETSRGLVIHRIACSQQQDSMIRLLQIADYELRPSWVEEQAVVGKVVRVQRKKKQVNLQHPIAHLYGRIVAAIRYRLYLGERKTLGRLLLKGCSQFALRCGNWCLWRFCRVPVSAVTGRAGQMK